MQAVVLHYPGAWLRTLYLGELWVYQQHLSKMVRAHPCGQKSCNALVAISNWRDVPMRGT